MGICIFWQRMRDSNPRKRSQSPVCYRYTNPLFGTVLLYAKETKCQAYISPFSQKYSPELPPGNDFYLTGFKTAMVCLPTFSS